MNKLEPTLVSLKKGIKNRIDSNYLIIVKDY